RVLYVVSDYNCSYCRRLHTDLEGRDIEVREIPVGYLGQTSSLKAAAALCADDPAAAARTFLSGGEPTKITTCTDGEDRVAENTAWAQAQGISGTPFLILQTGTTRSGYLEPAALDAFLGES
ncbi:MAG: DsbC family protein, partial [Litorimonas sp.]